MLDRFRGRIMFPIHNHTGKVVGFTGRILPQFDRGDMGKYVNSPETPIFQKSRLLYGFWKSKEAIREAKSAFLVEGQMDFLMSYQSGVKNVIASSGTALTADHLRVVHRLAEELIVSFDNDAAGSDAAERAIDLAEADDFSVKVATFAALGASGKDAAGKPFQRYGRRRFRGPGKFRARCCRRSSCARILFCEIFATRSRDGRSEHDGDRDARRHSAFACDLGQASRYRESRRARLLDERACEADGVKEKTLEEEMEKAGGHRLRRRGEALWRRK